MELKKRFWVYTNSFNKHARVHLGSCPHCNDGTGKGGAPDGTTGKWQSFDTYADAKTAAETFIARTGCEDKTIDCNVCNPNP